MNKPHSFDDFMADAIKKPSQHHPERDLWPGIEHAISQQGDQLNERTVKRVSWMSGAGMAAGFLALGLVVSSQWRGGNENIASQMTAQFETQKKSLLVSYQDTPAVIQNWQGQLADLEKAEEAVLKALESEPKNQALLKMLANIYQQQIDLINKVHAPKWHTI